HAPLASRRISTPPQGLNWMSVSASFSPPPSFCCPRPFFPESQLTEDRASRPLTQPLLGVLPPLRPRRHRLGGGADEDQELVVLLRTENVARALCESLGKRGLVGATRRFIYALGQEAKLF